MHMETNLTVTVIKILHLTAERLNFVPNLERINNIVSFLGRLGEAGGTGKPE